MITHSPRLRNGMAKRSATGYDSGANKRARYWLGDRAANVTTDEEADMEDQDITMWNNDDIDSDDVDVMFDGDDFCDDYDDEADDEDEQGYKGPVRGVSEDIVASMEMDY